MTIFAQRTMTKARIKYILNDLRRVTLFPRRYPTAQGRSSEYWGEVSRRYAQAQGKVDSTDWRWFIIEFRDGHQELAYLRVLADGFLSGKRPAIYRGLIIPRLISLGTFDHITNIRLAF